ncbi:MAG: hypothetical protein WAV50_03255 [Minisyncoccia bacterium]
MANLGFEKGARYRDICRKAMELGLWLCPAEVGPVLRMEYVNQPPRERVRIAMQPIPFEKRGDSRCIFVVGHGVNGPYLGSDETDSSDFYDACNMLGEPNLFVFVKPRRAFLPKP